jgi:hypothetical protein
LFEIYNSLPAPTLKLRRKRTGRSAVVKSAKAGSALFDMY